MSQNYNIRYLNDLVQKNRRLLPLYAKKLAIGLMLNALIAIFALIWIHDIFNIKPRPIAHKYAYYLNHPQGLRDVYLFKDKAKAKEAYEYYQSSRPEIPRPIHWVRFPKKLQANEKVFLFRYSRDSTLARVGIIQEVIESDTLYTKGWIPANAIHDSTYMHWFNKQYGRQKIKF